MLSAFRTASYTQGAQGINLFVCNTGKKIKYTQTEFLTGIKNLINAVSQISKLL